MPSVEYIVLVNGVELFRTSLRSLLNAICDLLDVQKMKYVIEEQRLKF
tara:strand:- start:8557 stop:8700 length:144 start_codon:yes stop_codon:yes gene_type:complete